MIHMQSTRRARTWRWMVLAMSCGFLAADATAQGAASSPPPEQISQPPSPGDAQGAIYVGGISQLRSELHKGDVVSVTGRDGQSWRGSVKRVGYEDIEVQCEKTFTRTGSSSLRLSVPYSEIAKLERHRDSTLNGTLVGAGVGAGLALGMFAYLAAVDANEMDEWGGPMMAFTAMTTGVGAFIGWTVDAVQSRPTFTYRPDVARGTKVSVGPMVSHAPGVAVRISF